MRLAPILFVPADAATAEAPAPVKHAGPRPEERVRARIPRRSPVPADELASGIAACGIAGAVYCDARLPITDPPAAALGPHGTRIAAEPIDGLKRQDLGTVILGRKPGRAA